jgi:hypothetical protein
MTYYLMETYFTIPTGPDLVLYRSHFSCYKLSKALPSNVFMTTHSVVEGFNILGFIGPG